VQEDGEARVGGRSNPMGPASLAEPTEAGPELWSLPEISEWLGIWDELRNWLVTAV